MTDEPAQQSSKKTWIMPMLIGVGVGLTGAAGFLWLRYGSAIFMDVLSSGLLMCG